MIRVRQVKVALGEEENLKRKVAKKLRVKEESIKNLIIQKKSLDARRKSDIYYVYEVDVCVSMEKKILKKVSSKDIFLAPVEEYRKPVSGHQKLLSRPVIVGSGPAGLFCAYMLAEQGYRPLILERGEKVEDRVLRVSKFWEDGVLNTNSNVHFGDG